MLLQRPDDVLVSCPALPCVRVRPCARSPSSFPTPPRSSRRTRRSARLPCSTTWTRWLVPLAAASPPIPSPLPSLPTVSVRCQFFLSGAESLPPFVPCLLALPCEWARGAAAHQNCAARRAVHSGMWEQLARLSAPAAPGWCGPASGWADCWWGVLLGRLETGTARRQRDGRAVMDARVSDFCLARRDGVGWCSAALELASVRVMIDCCVRVRMTDVSVQSWHQVTAWPRRRSTRSTRPISSTPTPPGDKCTGL